METFITDFGLLEVRESTDGHHELVGLAVPYNQTTDRAAIPGRRERVIPGAFASAVKAGGAKIRLVDENHTIGGRRPAGVTVALEERAGDKPGLFGRWRFYDTPEGRAAFENAREGTYGGLSAGFVVLRDRVVDGVREILDARLHHVSLVDEPAYEDALVLSVRSAADEEPPVDLSRYRELATPRPLQLAVDDTPLMVRIQQMYR